MCLPLKVAQPQFRLGRLGSIIDPAKDLVPGTNHHLLALNSGLTIADPQGRGVGLCPLDNPLISLDTPGCWKYSAEFVPQRPYVYVNLFNNQWTTNFRFWNEGTWTARVRIWAVDGPDCEPGLVTPTQEARSPLLAATATGAAGPLPAVQTGLDSRRKGIAVTAFGPESRRRRPAAAAVGAGRPVGHVPRAPAGRPERAGRPAARSARPGPGFADHSRRRSLGGVRLGLRSRQLRAADELTVHAV